MASILSADGKSIQPQAFRLRSAILTTFSGEEVEINNMLSEVQIRESIFLPTLILTATLKDTVNFFEQWSLSGQEKITLSMERTAIIDPDVTQNVDLEFYVTEYSAFQKSETSATAQAYTLKGVSSFAYNSKFLKISRAYSNSSTAEIQKIFANDLFFNNISISGDDSTSHKGILNIQEPMAAIEHLRRAAFDNKGAPFFVYQTLNGMVNVRSLTNMNDDIINPSYNEYVFLKGYIANPNTQEDYIERAQRILDTKSNLEMSKAFQASSGAYASNNFSLDITNKSYTNKIFDYTSEKSGAIRENATGNGRNVFSQDFKIGRDNSNSLNQLPDAHQEFLATNSSAFGEEPNYNGDMAENVEALNCYMALMDSVSQTIKLHGDFMLNAGRKIKLFYPRSIEAAAYKAISDEYTQVPKDKILSGTYLITSAIHRFEFGTEGGDEHFVDLEVKKDTIY